MSGHSGETPLRGVHSARSDGRGQGPTPPWRRRARRDPAALRTSAASKRKPLENVAVRPMACDRTRTLIGRKVPAAALWRNRLRLTKDTLLRNAAPRSDRTASRNETRDELAVVSLALAALALGLAAKGGFVHAPVSPIAFGVAAAVFAALLAIRALPLGVRRPVVFVVTLAALAALIGGLAYFQFVVKPTMVKGFMAAAFAPKPTAVSVEAARDREVAAAADGDRDAARLSGDHHRAAGGGGHLRPPPRIGRRRQSRRPPDQHRRFGRAGGPRQRARPAQERRGHAGAAEDAGRRAATRRSRRSIRRWRRATRLPRPSSGRGR